MSIVQFFSSIASSRRSFLGLSWLCNLESEVRKFDSRRVSMHKWIVSIVLMGLLSAVSFAEPQLTGIGEYEQLSKRYYVGALYLSQPDSNSASILASDTEQKMVLKVITDQWTTRRFAKVWRQDIALNNDLSADQELTGWLLNFTGVLQENLVAGDEMVISYVPGQGTTVTLNNERLVKHPGKKFFNALLSCWIGDVPYSQLFQQNILSADFNGDARLQTLLKQFEAATIPQARVGLVSRWNSQSAEAQAALAQAARELKRRQEQEAENKRIAAAKAAQERKKLEEERQKALALAEQRRKEAEQARQEQKTEQELAQALAAQQEAEAQAARLAREQNRKEQQQQQQQQQVAARIYARDLYRWEVTRDVYKRVSYPDWAKQFELEGVITAEIVVGRQGQLLGITSISPANSGILGQELRDAISRAAPFKVFPADLEDDQLQVKIAYEFLLSERVSELPPKPEPPAGVASGDLTPEQKALAWVTYQNQVINQIESEIQYPFWAKDLRQEGAVVARVTVMPDGRFAKVELRKKSRHSILNQEVEQAIERIGSTEPFPDWVDEQSLTLEVVHEFKL